MLPQYLLSPLSLWFHFFLLAILLLPLPDQMLVRDLLMTITALLLLLIKWNLHLLRQ